MELVTDYKPAGHPQSKLDSAGDVWRVPYRAPPTETALARFGQAIRMNTRCNSGQYRASSCENSLSCFDTMQHYLAFVAGGSYHITYSYYKNTNTIPVMRIRAQKWSKNSAKAIE
jgi:hypothetical protein